MARRAQPYQPPSTATMRAAQDQLRALRLLLAQRRLYNRAKRWSFLRWIGFSVIGVAAPILTVVVPQAAVVVGALAGIWIFLSRTWFSSRELAAAARAADIQEQFDQMVFGMPHQVARVPAASMEEISQVVGDDQAASVDAARENLLGWYPFDDRISGDTSVAIAQRANVAYSERLLNTNAVVWLVTTLSWSIAAVILSLASGLTLPNFLLGVAMPLLPALLDVWEQYRSTRRAGATRRSMADEIERVIRGQNGQPLKPENLLVWQDQLYELRRRSPQIPNLVYKSARTRNERAMNAAASELAEVALRRSTGGHP